MEVNFTNTPAKPVEPIYIEQVFAEKPGGGVVANPAFDVPPTTAVGKSGNQFVAIKAYKLCAAVASGDTSIKIKKGSGVAVGDIIATGKKGVACTAVDTSKAEYDTVTVTLGADMADGESVVLSWSAIGEGQTKDGSYTFTKVAQPSENTVTLYFDNSSANWSNLHFYIYGGDYNDFVGKWPGKAMTLDPVSGYYKGTFEADFDYSQLNVIFNNGSGSQSGDNVKVRNNGVYNKDGDTGQSSAIDFEADLTAPVEYFNLQGMPVSEPANGVFIRRQGSNVSKLFIP